MTMTTKTATFSGRKEQLISFLRLGIEYASYIEFINAEKTKAKVSWICEEEDTDIHDLINITMMEQQDIELEEINA